MNFAQVLEIKTRAIEIVVPDDTLTVELEDGRTISVPIGWYSRLAHGTVEERNHFEIVGSGHGIHWPELDEDISVESLLLGRQSGESHESFAKWLAKRKEGFGPVKSFEI